MVIGLTGGIGTGKSTVARILEEAGAYVINVDEVGHAAYAPGKEGWERIVGEFGREVVAEDGTIDRKRLGAIVFADQTRLARLNELLHPLMADVLRERIEKRRTSFEDIPIVVEAAIMIEANWQSMVDELWIVVASRDSILTRLAVQRGLAADAIEARIEAQMSDEERLRYADVVIDNSGTHDELREQLRRIWRERVLCEPF